MSPRARPHWYFNRSYYEETLVVRVHQELLHRQKIPPELITKDIWEKRFQGIRGFERYLTRNGVAICKFFLDVSNQKQKKRFLERIEEPEKNWKFSPADAKERHYWKAYMEAYEAMIRNTATKAAPWYVVPADNKSFTRVVVAAAVTGVLEDLDLDYPKVSDSKLKNWQRQRKSRWRANETAIPIIGMSRNAYRIGPGAVFARSRISIRRRGSEMAADCNAANRPRAM